MRKGRVHAWLRLIRLPNLLTVPGDPLAGYLLAAGGSGEWRPSLLMVLGASLLFYTSGLILNDVTDLEADRRERPQRPLPSGSVARAHAAMAVAICLVLANVLCTAAGGLAPRTGLLLTVLLAAYNSGLKSKPVIGPLVMGACRGVNVLLGAGLAQTGQVPLAAAGIEMLYVAAVTQVARTEMEFEPARYQRWLPLSAAVAGGITMAVYTRWSLPVAAAAAVWCVWASVCAVPTVRLDRASPRPGIIGVWIGGLLPMQAAFMLVVGAWIPATACLLAWPLFHLLGRRFSPS